MPIGATLGAVGSLAGAGASIAGASAASKARAQQQSSLADLIKQAGGPGAADIFGSRPEFEPVDYTPLYISDPGYRNIVAQVLSGDQANLPAAAQLSGDINKAISKSSLDRITGWDPSFQSALNTLYSTRNSTLKGRLPYTDALAITADRGRLANDLGMSGGGGPQIAADLGMKQLDLMTNIGPSLASSIASILNMVDPIQRHTTPEGLLLTPSQAVPMAIQENQFGATFDFQQNLQEAMFGAMPDPAAQGLFNLQAFQAGMGGAGPGIGSSVLSGLSGALSSIGSLFGGGGAFGGSGGGNGYAYGGGYRSPTSGFFQDFQQRIGDSSWTRIPKASPV